MAAAWIYPAVAAKGRGLGNEDYGPVGESSEPRSKLRVGTFMAAACANMAHLAQQNILGMNSTDKDRRPRYDESFKIEALRLWKTTRQSAGEVAKGLGISPATLYSWGRETRSEVIGSSVVASTLIREMKQEIARLREDNDKLREQREVLKKTLAILFESLRSPSESARARVAELPAELRAQ
jgi:transposase